MIEPLFRAMSQVHAKGLIHRDIAPDNLMLEDGDIRLLDFGCAREAATGSETMTIMLKPGFAPLEQYDGRGQGPWTDVYALCATLYYCLTGEVPPPATYRFRQDTLIPPSALGVNLLPQTEQALLTGMAVEPEDRRIDVAGLHSAFYGELNRRVREEDVRNGRGAEEETHQPKDSAASSPAMAVTQMPDFHNEEQPYSQPVQPERAEEPKRESGGRTAVQSAPVEPSKGKGEKKPALLLALIPILVLILGTGAFLALRPKPEPTTPPTTPPAEVETEEPAEAEPTQNDTTEDTTEDTTDDTEQTGNTTAPGTTVSPDTTLRPGSILEKPNPEEKPVLVQNQEQEEEDNTLTGASGFGAVPMETIEKLPESITCDKWKTDRTVQGIEWNTDTMDTFYVCYSSCIVAYDLEGKVKYQCNDVGDAQLFSMDYYDGYVLSVMRSSGNSRLKLRVYDALTLELKNSVNLDDIKKQHSEDKDTFHDKNVTPYLGGIMVSPALGKQKGERIYISYNVYTDEDNTLGLHEKQMIYEYDFRKTIKAKESTKAKRVLTVDVGAAEYGIQTLEYDRSTGNAWCSVHEGLSDFPLYCINGTSKDKKLSLVKNDGLKGWDCPQAENGLCSLGNNQFYVAKQEKNKRAVTVTLTKVSLSDLENLD